MSGQRNNNNNDDSLVQPNNIHKESDALKLKEKIVEIEQQAALNKLNATQNNEGSDVSNSVLSTSPVKKNVNRCSHCKKKVGLTAITCRCGGMYCSQHRYPETHTCTFDYKSMQQQKLEKDLAVAKAKKVASF